MPLPHVSSPIPSRNTGWLSNTSNANIHALLSALRCEEEEDVLVRNNSSPANERQMQRIEHRRKITVLAKIQLDAGPQSGRLNPVGAFLYEPPRQPAQPIRASESISNASKCQPRPRDGGLAPVKPTFIAFVLPAHRSRNLALLSSPSPNLLLRGYIRSADYGSSFDLE
ncbi:hypothetical protein BCV70DRAFT_80991 [Testicularia cyperi]|uniref:Uncharacterized protein n=1 Tax=Testicularia cyperi TaxID=1882483 RepID=A0A317XI37_9BASI|nr:hypothetical protein BCV70DRAFT_80991 [Testicularia cyperi]